MNGAISRPVALVVGVASSNTIRFQLPSGVVLTTEDTCHSWFSIVTSGSVPAPSSWRFEVWFSHTISSAPVGTACSVGVVLKYMS